jgi:hypothetical protein
MIPRETLFLYLIISCKNYSVGNISNSALSIPFNKILLKGSPLNRMKGDPSQQTLKLK